MVSVIILHQLFPISRSPYSQLEPTPPDKWEILPEQVQFEEELGRGEFGVVHKATFRKSDEMEVLNNAVAAQVVAVKVLHGKKYCSFHKGET